MNELSFYISTAWRYAMQMLPCAVLGLIGFYFLYPYRKKKLAAKGRHSGAGREGAILLFVFFAAGLSALTLFPAGFWHWEVLWYNITHFEPIIGRFYWGIDIWSDIVEGFQNLAILGRSWSHFLLLGNIIMFLPFGFFPALAGDKPRWWKALLTGFCVSAFIEIVQLFVGRSSDINDIILNTFGALCGFWVYLLLACIAPKFTSRFKLQKTEGSNGREVGDQAAL